MRTEKIKLAIVAVGLAGAMSVGATIVTFDDLATPNTGGGASDWGLVPTSYAGLTWTGWEVTKADGTTGSYQAAYNNSYGSPSSPNFAYNGGSGNYTVSTSGSAFNFNGAQVTSFVQNDTYQGWSSQSLTVNGYNGATLIGTWTGSLSANSFVALPAAAQFQGVTSVEFVSDNVNGGTYWGLDNFDYTPVPEPTTIISGVLMLLPFGASTLRILRRNRAG
jgi:hypothetical protein